VELQNLEKILVLCMIIIIGAGPAVAAYHFKRGRSVLVLEALPRYKPCGGGVSPAIGQWFDFDFSQPFPG